MIMLWTQRKIVLNDDDGGDVYDDYDSNFVFTPEIYAMY